MGYTDERNSRKNVVLALVVVLLSLSVAISGYVVVTMFNELADDDPFLVERDYEVKGIMVVSGSDHTCTGKINTVYSSDTTLYSVFTYFLKYGDGVNERNAKFSLMFDDSRNPVSSLYSHIGDENDIELWKVIDNGVTTVYHINKEKIVVKMDIENNDDKMIANLF